MLDTLDSLVNEIVEHERINLQDYVEGRNKLFNFIRKNLPALRALGKAICDLLIKRTEERQLVLAALQEIAPILEPLAKRADYFDDKPWISEDNLYDLSQLREAREKFQALQGTISSLKALLS